MKKKVISSCQQCQYGVNFPVTSSPAGDTGLPSVRRIDPASGHIQAEQSLIITDMTAQPAESWLLLCCFHGHMFYFGSWYSFFFVDKTNSSTNRSHISNAWADAIGHVCPFQCCYCLWLLLLHHKIKAGPGWQRATRWEQKLLFLAARGCEAAPKPARRSPIQMSRNSLRCDQMLRQDRIAFTPLNQ